MSDTSDTGQGSGFDFRTLVSIAALIAAAAAIYYAYSVDPAKQVADLEGSIKSLNAKINELPGEDDVVRLIGDNVKIPPAGPTAQDVQGMIDKSRLTGDDVQAQIDRSTLKPDAIRALIEQGRLTEQDVQKQIADSTLNEAAVQALIDKSIVTGDTIRSEVKAPLDELRAEIASLPSEDRVRAIASAAAEDADTRLVNTQLPNLVSANAVPKGAVVTFATPCPTDRGWKEYEQARGRFLVAAGKNTDSAGNEREFAPGVGDDDGTYKHTLTTDEMPAHRHAVDRQGPTRGIEGLPPIGSDGAIIAVIEQEMSHIAGKGQPHNNVPPYIALYFCEKT